MKYTYRYFKKSFPEWKKKKDSVLVRYFFRPISFWTAAISANLGINANTISIFSILVALLSASLFLINNRISHIVGASLIAFWMVLDCTDGNLARSVKKQAYGDFLDSCSSYCLIAFLFISMGVAAFQSGGVLIGEKNWYILFIGGMASIADPLSRLIYQKYLSNSIQFEGDKKTEEISKGRLRIIQDRVDKEIGLNGIFIPFAIICAVLEWLDIFVILYCSYYIFEFIVTLMYLITKTIKYNSQLDKIIEKEKFK